MICRVSSFLANLLAAGAILACATLAHAQGESTPAEQWQRSPHANAASESFTHWDTEGEIPTACAGCHSRTGFLDFVGGDGTAAGVVDQAVKPGTVIDCDVCHSPALSTLGPVAFPSGARVDITGGSVTCTVCHQGRASGVQVEQATAGHAVDQVLDKAGFINVHYRAAAATLFGAEVTGGYEYSGKSYANRFAHVPPFDDCAECHNPHSLAVRTDDCVGCHATTDPATIRTSRLDVDGDEDVGEGIAAELASLHQALGEAIPAYAAQTVGTPLIYSETAYPYYFNDTNGNGRTDDGEAVPPNRYSAWTPRLLRAAYNYHYVVKDPGAYAHNPVYTGQILFDSLSDLLGDDNVRQRGFSRP